ncbi:MAG: hypothetical protein J6333_07650 [Planctomycetes bacterium]|nr:hypothetical protein [Planctomycetota bacterium]
MKLLSQTKNFLRRLDEDESAPNTVEWVLLVIVALIILVAIWFIARWAMQKGDTGAQDVQKQIESGTQDAKDIGSKLGIK